MTKVKLEHDGTIEIPQSVVNHMGWKYGDTLNIEIAMVGDTIIIHKDTRYEVKKGTYGG